MKRATPSNRDSHGAVGSSDDVEPIATEPICVRILDAVKLTGIGRSTLYELIAAGDIETVKVGRSTFIRYASLKRLFEKH